MTAADRPTVCLLDGRAYEKNPYMSLLHEALAGAGVDVRTPAIPLFFPLSRTAIRQPDVDVIHIDWPYHYYVVEPTDLGPVDALLTALRALTFVLDLLVASLLSVAVVRTVHNRRHHDGVHARTERLVSEALFLAADAVTVKCDAAREVVADTFTVPDAARLHVVSDGSYVSAYEDEVSRTAARRELGIEADTFVYLFFGHVRRYKGVPELVDAFAALGHSDAELWIVGTPHDEALEATLQSRAATTDGVRAVLRFVPDDRVQYYLNAADVLALPYRRILNSGAVRLGLTYGLPVVAPRLGCLPETLPPDNEFLYDPAAPDGLRTELARAHDHPDLDRIAAANYDHAREQTWAATATALLEVYRHAIDTQTAGCGRERSTEPERR
jgi:glycosyltransferase involved in cell wall biosynthesis